MTAACGAAVGGPAVTTVTGQPSEPEWQPQSRLLGSMAAGLGAAEPATGLIQQSAPSALQCQAEEEGDEVDED